MTDTMISVQNLTKVYPLYGRHIDRFKEALDPRRKKYHHDFYALRDISFEVKKGETLGIIGRNGSGKSTLLKILSGVLTPTSGTYRVNGRVASLLELGTGFNPELTGIENIYFNGTLLGLSKKEIDDRLDKIITFADIGEFINQPVGVYSSGMFVRLAFAVQTHIDASIVIIDEALAVGDIFFRQKCYARLEQIRNSGAAILLVSHSMPDIEQYCKRAVLLDRGSSRFIGQASEATKHYYLLHQADGPARDLANRKIITGFPKKKIDHFNNAGSWLQDSALKDASALSQISNGMAKCTRYAICDHLGSPRANFFQGEIVVFYYEFQILKPITVPLAGVVLQNDRGVLVHGKGSLEYGGDVPDYISAGTFVRCRQSIELKLGVGEYTFEFGLASVDPETYKKRSSLSHEELHGRVIRICHLPNSGILNVNLRKERDGSQLTHHGVADLPGNFEFTFD